MVARVAVIGAGGMGSWFARFFKSRGDSVIVSDGNHARARHLASKIRVRYARNNVDAARGSDVVVLATPVNVVTNVIREILPALRQNTLLFDVCAVKSAVIPALRSAERRGIKVASIHPMFGPLASGLRGRTIIIVRTGKHRSGTEMVKRLFRGAHTLLVDPYVHDRWMAVTLALPHFLNMAFAATLSKRRSLARVRKYAGRTFNLQMLLAETVASEAETSADIQVMNREFVTILRALQRDVQSLAKIVNRQDRKGLVARYERIRDLLSADPEFDDARKVFERVCEMSSVVSRTQS